MTFPRSIRGRLVVMAVLALVPLLAMLGLASASIQRVREDSEVAANLELARATAAAFSGFVADVQRTAMPVGEALASGRLASHEADRLLDGTARAYGALLEVSWASPAGEILRSSSARSVGLRVGDRDYFLRILAGDDAVVGDLLDTRSGRGLAFVVAVAVRDGERRLVGVVLAPVDPARLLDLTLAVRRSGSGDYALVDRAGRIVVRSPSLDVPWEAREIASGQPFLRRALDGEEAAGPFTGEDGRERLGAAVPVPRTGWAARASRGREEVRSAVRRELARAGAMALLAGAAWLAASALLGGRIARSLSLLEAHAEALGRGERVAPPRLAVQEIARLADRYGRMAERLRASREAFATAFAAAPAGIVVVDGATLRARWANPAFLAFLEDPWRTRGVEGARLEEFLPGAAESGLAERFRRVASGDLPQADAEQRLDAFARGPTWWRWSVRAIPSADRLGARDLLFLATDVTEQARARRRIEEDRRRLEAVLRTLPVGVVIADPSGAIATSNDAARAVLGGPPSAVSREAVGSLRGWRASSGAPLGLDDWPLTRALRRRETVVGELIDVALRDGRRASLLVSAAPIAGAAGDLAGAVAAFEDVTELRRAQRRERLLREAGTAVTETLEFDEVGRRLAAFAAPQLADCCCMHEVRPDGALREIACARGAAGPACDGAEDALARRAIAARRTVHVRGDDVADGLRARGLRAAVAIPLLAGGDVLGVLTLATGAERAPLDGDDVRTAEELGLVAAQALENARLFGEVRRAVEARDEVLSVVSHDLRNPLGVVTLGARVLADLPEGDGAVERARATGARVLRAAERMARLIGDLLDLATLRAGRLAMERGVCGASDLLREAADEVRGAAREKGLELRVHVSPGVPSFACDRGRVLQVLGNLASNAVKATEAGGVWLAADPGDGEIVFTVGDTGPGIPEAERGALFERFRRGAGARYEGAGLGLSIARALVEAHGGRIWIESRPDAGTIVRFTLPAEPAAPPAAAPDHGAAGTSAGAAGAGR
ncbi:MAG TPA: ATP-binding protein [Anaeromyxobacter sp.]|nr:ATP-binding protein [Anaeromyxobacter sp.]